MKTTREVEEIWGILGLLRTGTSTADLEVKT